VSGEPVLGRAPGDRGPLVVAHLSDLHLGAHDPAAVEAVVADVTAAAPALTVVTGDVTMRARTGQFAEARAVLDRLPAPLLVVIGNHDVPLAPVRRLVSPYARYRDHLVPELDPVVEVPGVRVLGLPSMPRWRWKSGRVSRAGAAAVVDVLGGSPPGTLRVVALHHPPFTRGTARVVGRGPLVRALAAARVDLVLAGHIHRPTARSVELEDAGHRHGVVEVVAGTATSTRTRGVGRSWSAIRVDADAVTVEERHETPSGWCAGPTFRYPRQDSGWRRGAQS
jgi:3',5'-cyclic AMP phosphodiesterase CpdA